MDVPDRGWGILLVVVSVGFFVCEVALMDWTLLRALIMRFEFFYLCVSVTQATVLTLLSSDPHNADRPWVTAPIWLLFNLYGLLCESIPGGKRLKTLVFLGLTLNGCRLLLDSYGAIHEPSPLINAPVCYTGLYCSDRISEYTAAVFRLTFFYLKFLYGAVRYRHRFTMLALPLTFEYLAAQ